MNAVVLLTLAFLVHASAGLSVAHQAPLPSAPQLRPDNLAPDVIPSRAPRLLLNACGGDGGSVEYWSRVLRAADRDDRLRAARSLGGSGRTAAIPALVGALEDENLEVRVAAIQALGLFGERAKTVVPALEKALTHATPAIRTEAAKALERIRTR